MYECVQGIQTIKNNHILLWGDEIYADCNPVDKIVCNEKIRFRRKKGLQDCQREIFIQEELPKFLNFWEGISELIFYGAMYGCLKPFLHELGMNSGFIVMLVGPMGHLKTSIAQKFFLWGTRKDEMKSTFSDYVRNSEILEKINRHIGACYLIDDLHPVATINDRQKQIQRLDVIARRITENDNCAHVVTTGESTYEYGTLSCLDRIMLINIPKQDSDGLKEKKQLLKKLDNDFMPEIARYFENKLMTNYNDVLEDVSNFLEGSAGIDILKDENWTLRTSAHARYILLTQFLFRKYCCNDSKEVSGYDSLLKAIARNVELQEQSMCRKRDDDQRDYAYVLYKILSEQTEKRIVHIAFGQNDYMVNDPSTCFFKNGQFYFTSESLSTCFAKYIGKPICLKKAIKALYEAGVLVTYERYYQKKLNGINHYVISKWMLDLYVENIKQL